MISELILLYEMGMRHFDFVDDHLSGVPQQLVDLCDAITASDMEIAWSCEMRVDTCTEELCKKMKQAGCYLVAFGVESGDERVLKNLRKGITLDQSLKAFQFAHLAGLYTTALTMVGSPGETWDSVRRTTEFLSQLRPNFVSMGEAVRIIPGTRLAQQAKQMGCDGDWYTVEHSFAEIQKMRQYIMDNVQAKWWGD